MEENKDIFYMRLALDQAHCAWEKDEIPIGAVVVCRNRVVARAFNLTQTLNDPTAHAEMQAITAACNTLGGKYLNECTLYVTIEPCPMCAGSLYWAQIGRLVYGAQDPKKGYTTLNSSILHPKTQVSQGVLSDECAQLMKDFFAKKR